VNQWTRERECLLSTLQEGVGPFVLTLRRPGGRKWLQAWATSSEVVRGAMVTLGNVPTVKFSCVSRYRDKDFTIASVVTATKTGQKFVLPLDIVKSVRCGDEFHFTLESIVGLPWKEAEEKVGEK
jgi:hypothetical protein